MNILGIILIIFSIALAVFIYVIIPSATKIKEENDKNYNDNSIEDSEQIKQLINCSTCINYGSIGGNQHCFVCEDYSKHRAID